MIWMEECEESGVRLNFHFYRGVVVPLRYESLTAVVKSDRV